MPCNYIIVLRFLQSKFWMPGFWSPSHKNTECKWWVLVVYSVHIVLYRKSNVIRVEIHNFSIDVKPTHKRTNERKKMDTNSQSTNKHKSHANYCLHSIKYRLSGANFCCVAKQCLCIPWKIHTEIPSNDKGHARKHCIPRSRALYGYDDCFKPQQPLTNSVFVYVFEYDDFTSVETK